MLDKHESNKRLLILIIAVFIICIILLIVYFSVKNSTNDIVEDVIIDNKNSNIPHINIDEVDGIDKINERILNNYNDVMSAYDNNQVSYKYYVDDNILSILIESVVYYSLDGQFYHDFESYNIDLKQKKILTDDELLQKFGYSQNDLNQTLINKFKTFYEEEIEQGYFKREDRTFESYLIFIRGVERITDNVALYVKDGKLVAYRGFALNSVYEDYKYFKEDAFEFAF